MTRPRNILEWIAGGNLPVRAKTVTVAPAQTATKLIQPSRGGQRQPNVKRNEPRRRTKVSVEVETDSQSESEDLSETSVESLPKKVHFKKGEKTDAPKKGALKKGVVQPIGNCLESELVECSCGAEKCHARSPTKNHSSQSRSCSCRSCLEPLKPESRGSGHAVQHCEQRKQRSCQTPQNTNQCCENNSNNLRHDQSKKSYRPRRNPITTFLQQRMSRLIQPSRAVVLIVEDVVEVEADPRPNAFYDSRSGRLRVYHGPMYGNPTASLLPLVESLSIGTASNIGSPFIPMMSGALPARVPTTWGSASSSNIQQQFNNQNQGQNHSQAPNTNNDGWGNSNGNASTQGQGAPNQNNNNSSGNTGWGSSSNNNSGGNDGWGNSNGNNSNQAQADGNDGWGSSNNNDIWGSSSNNNDNVVSSQDNNNIDNANSTSWGNPTSHDSNAYANNWNTSGNNNNNNNSNNGNRNYGTNWRTGTPNHMRNNSGAGRSPNVATTAHVSPGSWGGGNTGPVSNNNSGNNNGGSGGDTWGNLDAAQSTQGWADGAGDSNVAW